MDYCSRGAKVWQRCLVLEAEVRPSAPSGFEMAGVHLPGLDSKEEWHCRARLLDTMCLCIAVAWLHSRLSPLLLIPSHDALTDLVPPPLWPCRSLAPAMAMATATAIVNDNHP